MSSPLSKLVCIKDFQQEALNYLDKNALDYYQSGADEEISLAENIKAFSRWFIRPRVLRDVSYMKVERQVLSKPVAFPLGVSPTAMQKMAHGDGEVANAKAAAKAGTIFILSTISTSSIEEVAQATPGSRKWFQLYVYKDRKLTIDIIRRAEAAGFEALVLTVDAPYFGKRRANFRNNFALPPHLRLANFESGTGASDGMQHSGKKTSQLNEYIVKNLDQTLSWNDVAWLKRNTHLPLIVKGILTSEDAFLALNHGVAGIFVSNHGARQLDTVEAPIDALPEIVKAVNGRCEVYLDGGVSTGSDVFKALALGARMVFAGRPLLWGLAVAGEAGAARILQIYREELELTMALAGVADVDKISPDYLLRRSVL